MKRIINCPHCGKLHLIETEPNSTNLYVFPGTKRHSKFLWGTFKREERSVSEVTCPYCGHVSTIVSLKNGVSGTCTIEKPPVMRLLFANFSLDVYGRRIRVVPLQWILFSAMIIAYFDRFLLFSLLSAILLIAFIFLFHSVENFQTFDFFGGLPLDLSYPYLVENSSILNRLFVKDTFHYITIVELVLLGTGIFEFWSSGVHTVSQLVSSVLVSLVIMYPFVLPIVLVTQINLVLDNFLYKVDFEKGSGFDKLGMIILKILSSGLVMSLGFALFLFVTENEPRAAIILGVVLTLSIGSAGFNSLWVHHKNIKNAKTKELEKLQTLLQQEYICLTSKKIKDTSFLEIKASIDAVKEIEEWPKSFKYMATAVVTVGSIVLSALISHLLG